MDTIEQKEKDTIELRKLTRFQKKQVLSLVDRFLKENEESKKEGFLTCPNAARPILHYTFRQNPFNSQPSGL